MELFYGCGQLSAAVKQRTGAVVLKGVDLTFGPWKIDLSREPHVELIKSWLRSGHSRYLHMGTPCTSFLQVLRGDATKRSAESPEGPRGEAAIELANKACWEWPLLVAPPFEASRREFAELKRKMLLWAGDVEPHPGPGQ